MRATIHPTIAGASITGVAPTGTAGCVVAGTDRGLVHVGADGSSRWLPALRHAHVAEIAVHAASGAVAAGSVDGEVCIVDGSGDVHEVDLGSRVRSLAWSGGGCLLAACSQAAGLVVLGADGSRCFGLPPSRRWRTVSFHERNRDSFVVAAGAGGATWIDPVSGAIAHHEPTDGAVTSMASDPSGRWLALGDVRGEVRMTDTDRGDTVEIAGWPDPVELIEWMPGVTQLVVAGGDEVTRWSAEVELGDEEPEPARTALGGSRITALAAHPWRPCVAVGTEDGRVVQWDAATTRQLAGRRDGDWVTALQWNGTDDRLFVGTRNGGGWMTTDGAS